MPFSKTSEKHTEEYWTKHYTEFLKPLIEENSAIQVHRSKPIRGDIIKQIITDLLTSPLSIADLTDMNPNVFWELGVRQSFRNGTITIAENGVNLPFDISPKGTLFYFPNDHIKNAQFCNDLKLVVSDCIQNQDTSDSSVLETLSGRGTLYGIIHEQETIRRIDALIDECDWNLRLLKKIIDYILFNRENPENTKWVTSRFMSACIELLLTSRYIDDQPSLYLRVRVCFSSCLALNDQLNIRYTTDKVRLENWFEKYNPMYLKRFNLLRLSLTKVRYNIQEKINITKNS
jgi:hypothetical protein